MRYVLAFGETEDAPLIAGPGGGVQIYFSQEEAGKVAREICRGPTAAEHPMWNVFVKKLVTTALYMPVHHTPGQPPVVDETIIHQEVEKMLD